MTREEIQKRISELTQHKELLWQQINAAMGAIEDCQHWLAKVDEEEKSGKEEGKVKPKERARVRGKQRAKVSRVRAKHDE